MTYDFGSFNMWGTLRKVAIRRPAAAFVSEEKLAAEWRPLNFHSKPVLKRALDEYGAVEQILRSTGAELIELPPDGGLTIDLLYTHDALVGTPRGMVKPLMGKPTRRGEPSVNGGHLAKLGMPVIGEITSPGLLEGGDLVWIDRHTLLAGIGYRTNLEGVRQLQVLAGPDVEVVVRHAPLQRARRCLPPHVLPEPGRPRSGSGLSAPYAGTPCPVPRVAEDQLRGGPGQ